MSELGGFFAERFAELEAFCRSPDHVLMRLVVDGELRRMPLKFLMEKDKDPEFAHLLIAFSEPWEEPRKWFALLLDVMDAELDGNAEVLEEEGVSLPRIRAAGQTGHLWQRFLGQAQALAKALPADIASLVFVIDPERVDDPAAFARGMTFLAEETVTERLKFVVIDDRQRPCLAPLDRHPKATTMVFYEPPEAIGRRAEAILAKGKAVPPVDRRKALAAAALMAHATRDYAKAEAMGTDLVEESRAGGNPAEVATALYNLGNTQLAAGKHEEAVATFTKAADGCNYHELDELAPLVFCNLGIALHRTGDRAQSFDSLKVARDGFRRMNNIPGEAHVCDTLAQLYEEAGQKEEARRSWSYALSLYDRIESPAMKDVKEGGQKEILEKMKRYGHAHG